MSRLLLIPLLILVLLIGSMVWSGSATDSPADFTFINRGEVTTLDPVRISWLQDIRIAYALWETLYTPDPQTLRPVPGAAESFTLSEDHTVYTFTLRPNGKWSNGQPVVAQDFVFGWRRMLENPDEYTSLFHLIHGAEAYQSAFAKDSDSASFEDVAIRAIDDRTLEVRLERPVPYFIELVAFTPFVPQNRAALERYLRSEGVNETDLPVRMRRVDEGWTHPPHLVGNGPYRLDKWEFKRRIRLVKSDTYWNADVVHTNVIDCLSTEDSQTAFLKFHSGGCDWLSDVDPQIAAELLKKKSPDLKLFTGFGTYFYSINCTPTLPGGRPNPFVDPRVRQAFAMALDKQTIVDTVSRMGENVATHYIPTGIFPGYTSRGGHARNPELGRKLLADAGYPGGKNFPSVTLLFNTGAHHANVAQVARKAWLDELGVDVTLEGVEVQVFRQRLNKKEYALARASWIGDYADPSTFTDKYRTTSQGNDAGWLNTDYDKLLDQAAIEVDPAKRFDLISRAEGMLNDAVPIIPIYYYNNAYLYRDNVSGIPNDARSMVMFQSLRVVKP